eukprot:6329991-Amphidinium_carterae.1
MIALYASATLLLGHSEVDLILAHIWVAQSCVFSEVHTCVEYYYDGVPVNLMSDVYIPVDDFVDLPLTVDSLAFLKETILMLLTFACNLCVVLRRVCCKEKDQSFDTCMRWIVACDENVDMRAVPWGKPRMMSA